MGKGVRTGPIFSPTFRNHDTACPPSTAKGFTIVVTPIKIRIAIGQWNVELDPGTNTQEHTALGAKTYWSLIPTSESSCPFTMVVTPIKSNGIAPHRYVLEGATSAEDSEEPFSRDCASSWI